MKKFAVLGFLLAGALTGIAPASAADMARPYVKAPPIVAAGYDWSGFYIGVNGGYGSARKCWDITRNGVAPVIPSIGEGCHDADGGTGGGQIGYRWQSAQWVFGIEGQGNFADFRGSNPSLFFLPGTVTNRTRIDAFGMLTGQFGYTWNNILLYVRGGGAVVGDRYTGIATPTGLAFDTARETRGGGVIGLGLDFGITPNWIFGINYDRMMLGARGIDFVAVAGGGPSRNDRIREDVDVVTVRVNYKWGGPIVAKY